MDTFRHTFFARLSMLLLVAVLHVDAFAELCGMPYSAAGDVLPASRAAVAAFDPGDPAGPVDVPSQLLDVQDFLEPAHSVACCLHRAPRLSRPLPDSGCCTVTESVRRTCRPDLPAVGRTLRAHYSLYCVYRI